MGLINMSPFSSHNYLSITLTETNGQQRTAQISTTNTLVCQSLCLYRWGTILQNICSLRSRIHKPHHVSPLSMTLLCLSSTTLLFYGLINHVHQIGCYVTLISGIIIWERLRHFHLFTFLYNKTI